MKIKLYEGFIRDKNMELISIEKRIEQEREELLERTIKELKPRIEECLSILMDDYDLVQDDFMTHGSAKMIDNVIFGRTHTKDGGHLIIHEFKYKITNDIRHIDEGGEVDFISDKFVNALLNAYKKLSDIGLDLVITLFEVYDEEFNEETSRNYATKEMFSEFVKLLSTGKFVISELYLSIIDKNTIID
jgi:hypothetical protein